MGIIHSCPIRHFVLSLPLLSPYFGGEFQWAKIAALFPYILSSGIFCRIFWWCIAFSFLVWGWACPDAQPYSHEGTLKPWFHPHALDKNFVSWLELRREWAKSDSVQSLVPPNLGNNREKIKQSPAASVTALPPKGSQETLDPNQMSLGFCKSSMARTCSTFYPNLLFRRWDSRRHSQCCYIHLLYPICHATGTTEATPAQTAHLALLQARIKAGSAQWKWVNLSHI